MSISLEFSAVKTAPAEAAQEALAEVASSSTESCVPIFSQLLEVEPPVFATTIWNGPCRRGTFFPADRKLQDRIVVPLSAKGNTPFLTLLNDWALGSESSSFSCFRMDSKVPPYLAITLTEAFPHKSIEEGLGIELPRRQMSFERRKRAEGDVSEIPFQLHFSSKWIHPKKGDESEPYELECFTCYPPGQKENWSCYLNLFGDENYWVQITPSGSGLKGGYAFKARVVQVLEEEVVQHLAFRHLTKTSPVEKTWFKSVVSLPVIRGVEETKEDEKVPEEKRPRASSLDFEESPVSDGLDFLTAGRTTMSPTKGKLHREATPVSSRTASKSSTPIEDAESPWEEVMGEIPFTVSERSAFRTAPEERVEFPKVDLSEIDLYSEGAALDSLLFKLTETITASSSYLRWLSTLSREQQEHNLQEACISYYTLGNVVVECPSYEEFVKQLLLYLGL